VHRRWLVIVTLLAITFVVASAAEAKVTLIRVTSPVSAGAYATLTIMVSKPARCSITVYYKSGPSEAQGLYPKRTNAQLRVSWTWKVGTRTTPGRWPIVVSCGSAGTLRTKKRRRTLFRQVWEWMERDLSHVGQIGRSGNGSLAGGAANERVVFRNVIWLPIVGRPQRGELRPAAHPRAIAKSASG